MIDKRGGMAKGRWRGHEAIEAKTSWLSLLYAPCIIGVCPEYRIGVCPEYLLVYAPRAPSTYCSVALIADSRPLIVSDTSHHATAPVDPQSMDGVQISLPKLSSV